MQGIAIQILSLWKMAMVLAVGLAAAILALVWLLRRKRAAAAQRKTVRAPRVLPAAQSEAEERAQLIERYCDIQQARADKSNQSVYRSFFLRQASALQRLVGLTRRMEQGGLSEAMYWSEMDMLLENSGILSQLEEEGAFRITAQEQRVDRAACRAECAGVEMNVLRRYVAEYGAQKAAKIDYKALLAAAGPAVQETGRAYAQRALQDCLRAGNALRARLADANCHCLFADDEVVRGDAALRVDFQEEDPRATELPGLYVRRADGRYALIGGLTGTARSAREIKKRERRQGMEDHEDEQE